MTLYKPVNENAQELPVAYTSGDPLPYTRWCKLMLTILAVLGSLVMAMIGQRGRYLDTAKAVLTI